MILSPIKTIALYGAVFVFAMSPNLTSFAQQVRPIAGQVNGIVSKHFISDSFDGPSISRNVWGWYGTNQPNNITLAQDDGALNMSISSTATNNFTAGAVTRCKLRGDFDATLSFRLVEWQPYNGVWVTLQAADTGGFDAYRVSWLYNLSYA
jgi:hypothetical protein